MPQMNSASFRPLYVVETPPYIHKGITVPRMMRDTCIALLPALAMAVLTFGFAPLRVVALATGTAMITEALCARMTQQPLRLYDGSAFLSGLLLAMLLPVTAPWWLVIIGSIMAMVLGKHIFGGLGANPLCTALVGWACLMLSWPVHMDANSSVLHTTFIDPLVQIKYFGVHSISPVLYGDFLLGKQIGGLGTVYIGALLVGGLYALLRQAIRWEVPVVFLASVYATGFLFWQWNPEVYMAPELYILTGSTVFAAFFLATDHASSPVGMAALILYSLLAGVLAVLIRLFGTYTDGALFAILVANMFTPLFDMIRPAPWGKRKRHVA